jgi:hypothetical protein
MKLREQFLPHPRRQPVRFVLSSLLYLYALLLAVPGILFAEHVQHGAIAVYAHKPQAGLDADLRRADALVARSAIDDPSLTQRIVLTQSHREFAFFVPAASHSLGVTYNLLNETFLPPSDAAADLIHSDLPAFNQRPLSAVIAHERVHALLEHHFGLSHIVRTPAWKQEGYCDYIAGSPSVGSDANGLRLLAFGESTLPAALYFRDALRVRYLLDAKHLTVDQLFAQSFDTAALDREALAFAMANESGR